MKFGKGFRTHQEKTLPEWRDKFLCYNLLKKLLKRLPTFAIAAPVAASPLPRPIDFQQRPWDADRPLAGLQDWFVAILNEELEKLNDFYVDKEEEFVIRFQELKERIEVVKEKSSEHEVFTSGSEFSEEVRDIRMDLVTIHGEMVLLKHYSSLNFSGIVKILKKYDRRTGGLLRLPFTQHALRQPFLTTEPLMRLVRECEPNLEFLSSLEAEFIDGIAAGASHSNSEFNDSENIAASQTPSNQEVDMDII